MVRNAVSILILLVSVGFSTPAIAHCDTTKGPVVTAARAALDAANPDLVLHWVRAEDEAAVRSAFEHALRVRALGPDAKALADRYFFETLVRIHRAGEGAPFTGLLDGEPEPIIAATDRALERGSSADLEQLLVAEVRAGLANRFAAARGAKGFRPGDVRAGRAFVATYVPLTHWVEGVSTAAKGTAEHDAAGDDHAARVHPAVHEPGGHGEREDTASAHDRNEFSHLPWFLTAGLAVAALIEGALLLRRRRHATA
jgi:hypothetical protein